jgi:tRNA pseudouridine55 synthase
MHGALLIDKPSGPTSHDVVAFARRTLKTPRVGHTGTLDPLATGLLLLRSGHATRLSRFLVTDEKEYIADIRLWISTPTYDSQSLDEAFRLKAEATRTSAEATRTQGEREPSLEGGPGPSLESPGFRLQAEEVDRVLQTFLGTYPQLPPPYSAKKVDGVRAYKKARRNEPVELKVVQVTVRELEVVAQETDPALLRLRIVCTAGFYVRSLAQDLGQLLGCGAHLEALRRTRAGPFSVADAMTLDAIEAAGPGIEGRLVDLNTLLGDMPAVTLTEEGLRRAGNGNTLGPAHLLATVPEGPPNGHVRVLDASGGLVSVAETGPDGLLHPLLVLR